MRERAAHDPEVDQARNEADRADAERGVPAGRIAEACCHVVAYPGRGRHRDHRAEIHRHVVDRERTVDAGFVPFVDLAHEIAGVRLEQAVADDDDAEREIGQVRRVGRNPKDPVTHSQHGRADHQGPARSEQAVADPAADRGSRVDQCGRSAPDQVGVGVVETELLHQVRDHQHLHAVETEALPHLYKEDRGERAGLRDGGRKGAEAGVMEVQEMRRSRGREGIAAREAAQRVTDHGRAVVNAEAASLLRCSKSRWENFRCNGVTLWVRFARG